MVAKTKEMYFSQFWRLEFKTKMLPGLVLSDPLSGLPDMHLFPVSSLVFSLCMYPHLIFLE